jgi:hypothetical protein
MLVQFEGHLGDLVIELLNLAKLVLQDALSNVLLQYLDVVEWSGESTCLSLDSSTIVQVHERCDIETRPGRTRLKPSMAGLVLEVIQAVADRRLIAGKCNVRS